MALYGRALHVYEGKTPPCLRIRFRYVRGLRQAAAETIVRERQARLFVGIEGFGRRVPELQKSELVTIGKIGALKGLGQNIRRRSALWQVERAARPAGPLLESIPEQADPSPLERMTDEERLVADFHGSSMTTGPHTMSYCRAALDSLKVKLACDLPRIRDGNTRAAQ